MLRSTFFAAFAIASLLAPASARAQTPPATAAAPAGGGVSATPAGGSANAAPSLGHAGEPRQGHLNLAILSGYGFNDFGADTSGGRPYRFGFGARAGYTFGSGIYLGGTFVRHLGESNKSTLPDVDATFRSSLRVTYAGAELGSDFAAGPLVVRPYVGVGASFVSYEVEALGIKAGDTDGAVALWPGVTAFCPVGDVQLGVDLRYVLVTESEKHSSPSLFGHIGYQF